MLDDPNVSDCSILHLPDCLQIHEIQTRRRTACLLHALGERQSERPISTPLRRCLRGFLSDSGFLLLHLRPSLCCSGLPQFGSQREGWCPCGASSSVGNHSVAPWLLAASWDPRYRRGWLTTPCSTFAEPNCCCHLWLRVWRQHIIARISRKKPVGPRPPRRRCQKSL